MLLGDSLRRLQHALLQRKVNYIRRLWINDACRAIQSLHRHVCARRFHFYSLRPPERWPSLQSLHRNLWRYTSRLESNRAVGTVLRAAGQQICIHAALFHRQWFRRLDSRLARRPWLWHLLRLRQYLRGKELQRRHVRRTRRQRLPEHWLRLAEI